MSDLSDQLEHVLLTPAGVQTTPGPFYERLSENETEVGPDSPRPPWRFHLHTLQMTRRRHTFPRGPSTPSPPLDFCSDRSPRRTTPEER